MTCHNCGAPQTDPTKGRTITITKKAENSFQRNSKITVWTCCKECAVQAIGISKYGPATHRWPITLAQLRAMTKFEEVAV